VPGCGKAFRTKGEVRLHGTSHSDERPVECPQCYKAFKTKGEVRKHSKVHMLFKPFICRICGRGFKVSAWKFLIFDRFFLIYPKYFFDQFYTKIK
jgi:hypothetical protein